MYKDHVASIMVTYNPEADVVDHVESIIKSCLHLVVIDNGSNENSLNYIKKLEGNASISVIYNKKNMGLGTALNQGIRHILNSNEMKNVDWIATFDQDSHVENNYFNEMLQVYEKISDKDKVVVLAPNWSEQKIGGSNNSQVNQQLEPIEQKTVITSGSLVKKEVFNQIGLFEEDYFIDFLDIEFCLRARHHGYKIVIIPQVIMVHNLGNTEEHRLLKSRVKATNHNYIRRYYITRNRLYTYKKYFRTEKEWLKEDLTATMKEFIIVLLFEKDRVRKVESMVRGTVHALFGRKGPR